MTWLHLSDLHTCKPDTGWDAHRVLDSLIPDLKKMEEDHGLRPDLVFFTGDLAFGQVGSGKGDSLKDQFDEGHEFLERVRTAFSTSVQQEDVFIVPGNHDVNRAEVTDDQCEWLDGRQDSGPITKLIQSGGKQWQRYMERLDAYRKFLKRHGYKHLLVDEERLIYAVKRNIAGKEVGIAGLNSAWSCGRDREKGKIWLAGDWQIGELTSQLKGTYFRLALMHHPHNWLSEHEDSAVRKSLERDFRFWIHGHEHDEWVSELADGHVRIAAAACYERSDEENGYNFVRLDLDNAKGEVWLRRYDSHGGGWVPRVVAGRTNNDGLWPLNSLKWLGADRSPSDPSVTSTDADAEDPTDTAIAAYHSHVQKAWSDRWSDELDVKPDE